MAAPKRQDFVLVLRTRDQAKAALKALGATGFREARRMGREYKKVGKELLSVERIGKRVTKALKGGFKKLTTFLRGNLLTTIALVAAAFISLQSIRAATTNASEFQIAMAEVNTILPDTVDGTINLRDAVLDLASAQGENEKIVARGLYQAISAGVSDAGEALAVLGEAQQLAVAGVASTDQTVDLLTTTINAYRLETEDAARISDVFFETVRLGKTTISELAGSIGPVLPLAAALGVDIEQVNAALATLTQQGFSTSDASTALRALFKALLKESGDLDTVFQRLGKTYDLNTVRTRGLVATLQDLATGLSDPSEALEVLGARIEATNALLGLTGKNFDSFSGTSDALSDSLGSTSKAYEKIADTDARRVQIAINAVRIAFLDLGDAILKSVADAIDSIGGVEALQATFRTFAQRLGPILDGLITSVANLARGFVVTAEDIEVATLKAQVFGLRVEGVFAGLESAARTVGLISDDVNEFDNSIQRASTNAINRLAILERAQANFNTDNLFGLEFGQTLESASTRNAATSAVESFVDTARRALDNNGPFAIRFEADIQDLEKITAQLEEARGAADAAGITEAEAARLVIIEKIASASRDEIEFRATAGEREKEITKQRQLQLDSLKQQLAVAERTRGEVQAAARFAAPSSGSTAAANLSNLTAGLGGGVPNFRGGVATPTVSRADAQRELNALLGEQQALQEAIRIAGEKAVLDAEKELSFRELLGTVASQTATSAAERAQIERDLLGVFEARTLAQAREIGVEGGRLDALESALGRLREAREADIEATRRGIDVSFQSFEAFERSLLSQTQGQESAIELINREVAARRESIEFLKEQNRLTDDQAAKLLALLAIVEKQRVAAAGSGGGASGQSFDQQRVGLLGQLNDQSAKVDAIRATAEARRADITLQQQQNKLNLDQADTLRSLVTEIENQNVAQASVTPTMERAQKAVQGYTDSLAFGLEDALVAVATGAKSTKEAMSDFVKSLIVDLIRLAVRLVITNALLAIFDGLTLNFAALSAAPAGAAAVTAAAVSAQSASSSFAVDGFANGGIQAGGFAGLGAGGIVGAPSLAAIGEGGMNEAVVPLPDGRTIPVSMGGGGGNTFFFNFPSLDAKSGTQFVMDHREDVKAVMLEALTFSQQTRSSVRGVAGTRGGGL